MLLSAKNFIGLRVETKNGRKLGRIRDFSVDANTLEIKKFYVRPAGIVKGLVDGNLIIGRESVVSINEEKAVVEDLIEKEPAKKKISKKAVIDSSPVAASSIK